MKNIYLDWAELQNYLDGHLPEITALLNGNRLLLSLNHIADLSVMTDLPKAKKRLKALDGIPEKGFLPQPDFINDWYNEVLINRELGVLFPKRSIVSKRLAEVFDIWPEHELWEDDSFSRYYEEVIETGKGHELFKSWYESSSLMSWRLAQDRKLYWNAGLEQQKLKQLRRQQQIEIEKKINELRESNPAYSKLVSLNQVKPLAIKVVARDDFFMNFFNEFNAVNARSLMGKNTDSDKFLVKTRSDFSDFGHLYGAMVAEIVTVDKRVKKNIDSIQSSHFKKKFRSNSIIRQKVESE